MKALIAVLLTAAMSLLASCHGGSTDPVCEITSSGLNTEGEKVLVCEKFHANAPYIRIEKIQGAFIGGLDTEGLFTFLNANNVMETVTLVHPDGRPYACNLGSSMGIVPDDTSPSQDCDPVQNGMVSQRRIYTLYKAQGELDSARKTLTATSIHPYLVATPSAIDSLLNRPFAGSANFRKATYDPEIDGIISYEDASTPILLMPLRPGNLRRIGHDESKDSPLEKTQPTVFQIANYNSPVQGPDGNCYPALTSFGPRNPLHHLKVNEAQMARHPSMHQAGTHTLTLEAIDLEDSPEDGWHFAIGTGSMSGEIPSVMFNPATWLSAPIDLTAELTQVQRIHGIPNGLELKLVPATAEGRTGKSCL